MTDNKVQQIDRAELATENTGLRDTLLDVLASLVAARHLLRYDKPRLHVGSSIMFKQMLQDYDKSIERGRQALADYDAEGGGGGADGRLC